MASNSVDLMTANLEALLKTQLIQLCKDRGLSTYGLKTQLIARLAAQRAQLPSPAAAAAGQPPATTLPPPPPAWPTTIPAGRRLFAGRRHAVGSAGSATSGRPGAGALPSVGLSPSHLFCISARVRAAVAPPWSGSGLSPSLRLGACPHSPSSTRIHANSPAAWPQCLCCYFFGMGLPTSLFSPSPGAGIDGSYPGGASTSVFHRPCSLSLPSSIYPRWLPSVAPSPLSPPGWSPLRRLVSSLILTNYCMHWRQMARRRPPPNGGWG